tara:strand:- start:4623 stop:6404 length:1782 start_codon:yes stop_codon:yes gene_type:complete
LAQLRDDQNEDLNRSPFLEALNVSPYEPKGQREKELVDQISLLKKAFANSALTEFSQEGQARAGGGFENGAIPPDSWWYSDVRGQLLGDSHPAAVNLDTVYQTALANSTQIKVFGNIPVIRETGINEARGAFDGELYTTTGLDRLHEPVGSSLEVGGDEEFFRQREWSWESGIRKRFRTGAQVSLSQEMTRTRNNSEFFIPNDQGKARLKLTVVQPLLRGAGIRYNESVIRIAKLDHETGSQEFLRQLETHLSEVNRSYWSLYLARAIHVEKFRLVQGTEAIVEEMRKRGQLDTMASQRARAEAALASRRAELVRAELAIKNSESRLRALINDPNLIEQGIGELIPDDLPVTAAFEVDFETAVGTAMQYRPEILQAEAQLKAANIRERMAKQDRLPELNIFGEGSISDLQSDGDWEGATRGEYNDGHPSWSVGLSASVSLERRFTRARHLRSELELRQQKQRLQATLETIQLEVQVAYREVTTAYPDMRAKYISANAALKDLNVLNRRRGVDADGGNILTSDYLGSLLEAQDRLQIAREEFLQSLVVYNVALTNLERAKGTLIRGEGIQFEKGKDTDGLPELRIVKGLDSTSK